MLIPSSSSLMQNIVRLCGPIKESLAAAPYSPPQAYPLVSIKSHLQSLLPDDLLIPDPSISERIKNFALLCAAIASASNTTSQHLSWIPESLSLLAISALKEFAGMCYEHYLPTNCSLGVSELELDSITPLEIEKKLLIRLIPDVVPLLKANIKESSADLNVEGDETCAAIAGVPVAYAILAASQFRWIVTQIGAPHIGKLCPSLIPCALTALDHWSTQVKDQGMISCIHLGKNVKAADVGGYGDAILDACCQNIASDDDIWPFVVEMSVLIVTLTQKSNPRSQWYEKLLDEMLNHLERQPRNKRRRITWLTHSEHLLNGLGLTLLAHFRRLFPLFFRWMHGDDDETILLVLERMIAVLRLTWIRNSPFIARLVDELVVLYKSAALKSDGENIRSLISEALDLLQMSRRQQFDSAWVKYRDDPNLATLSPLLSGRPIATVLEDFEYSPAAPKR